MKILWITNILFPEVKHFLTGENDLKASGGWMLGSANALINRNNIKLYIASVSNEVAELTKYEGKQITYYVLPLGKGNLRINNEYNSYWRKIQNEIKPDIVHIHGTEYSHGYAYMQACGSKSVVISIQGMTSACAFYYNYGMSKKDIYCNLTIRDFLKGLFINGNISFKKRSKFEKEMIKMSNHIIGRTSWDKARTWAINPDAKYHFCNETLRTEFYDGSMWDYDKCTKHSIFLSQGGYPIKGLHQILKAMPLILRHYPDTIIRIAGNDITNTKSFLNKLRLTSYGLFVKKLIRKYNLENNIIFTGSLNAEEMKREYLNSNVFICPSTIENSPNSLAEAQILGVPCIASYVGGIADMMVGNEINLYRFEEIEMLAEKICRLFSDKENQILMINVARNRHDPVINSEQLYSIYQQILEQ